MLKSISGTKVYNSNKMIVMKPEGPHNFKFSITIAQLGVQYGHMGYYFITVAFMLVTVMLLSCCVPYYVVLLLDVMFVHVLHLSCLVCMFPNCFVAFPLYVLVHGF